MIIVAALDRLTRDAGHLRELLLLLDAAGVRIVASGQALDRATPEGRLQTGILGEFAEFERAKVKARTKAGLAARARAGKPVGALPLGYRAKATIVDGETITRRVIDPDGAAIVERICDELEQGRTYGAVCRALNHDGLLTARGKTWTVRTLRRLAQNDVYTGKGGYPVLIDADRFERVQDRRKRMDPVAVRARKGGGRKPTEPYLLQGVGFCAACQAPMYVRRLARGRVYVCRDVREARGTCDSQAIDAAAIEQATIEHLSDFRLDVEAWLRERADEGRAERSKLEQDTARLRANAAKLATRMAATRTARDEALDAGEPAVAAQALRELARYDDQLADAEGSVAEAEARLAEWTVSPDVGAQLKRYADINEAIGEQLKAADGVAGMNAVLRRLLGAAYMVRNDHEGTVVFFELARDDPFGDCDWVRADSRGTRVAQRFA